MSRSVSWRRVCSDAASWHQDEALNSTIYILREIGPTGFLLKEENETKKFKVLLGDPHTCTCQVFRKEKDLCKHLCWVLLRKFRVPRTNPVSWQLGLVEREINEILKGIAAQQQGTTANARRIARQASQEESEREDQGGGVKQREITQDDVCPICQEELLEKRLPVTYCKFGCGNNIHIKCMKVWAEHQKSQGAQLIKCPMCREDFGPFTLLQQEFRNSSVPENRAAAVGEHLGTTCKKCHMCPITGKCYRCSVCADYHLCQACFNTPTHSEHSFEFRQKANQRWRPAERGQGRVLPEAIVQNLMSRDITEQDYDLLLQLDSESNQQLSDLTEETVRSLPLERVRANSTLLHPGQQCRICLRPYQEGQYARRLPCRHKFHKECIDTWLLHRHATCPVDGTVYTNESVRQIQQANRIRQQQTGTSSAAAPSGRLHPNNTAPDSDLQIPGIGIARLGNSQVLDRHMHGVLEVSGFNSDQHLGQRPRSTFTPEQLPDPYVYTASGDYIQFPDNPGDIRDIRNAAQRMRARADSETRLAELSDTPGQSRESSARGAARMFSFDLNPIHLIPNSSTQTRGGETVNRGTPARPHQQRESGLDFTNLLLADVRRNSHPTGNQGNGQANSTPSSQATNQNRVNSERSGQSRTRSDTTEHGARGSNIALNPENLTPSINLTIGSITSEADNITRANRGRMAGGISAAGRAAILRRNIAQAAEQYADDRGVTGMARQLDVSGQSYAHTNGDVSPAKPPSGADSSTRVRGGKLRSKPLYKDPRRPRSTSRERTDPAEGASGQIQTQNGLYIGHDPNSIAGFTSEFAVSTNGQAGSHVANRVKRGRSQGSAGQSDERHRWGATQNLSADEMMLSGSSYN